jgi:hypothetical protein
MYSSRAVSRLVMGERADTVAPIVRVLPRRAERVVLGVTLILLLGSSMKTIYRRKPI